MTRTSLILTRSMTTRSLRSKPTPSYKIQKQVKIRASAALKSRRGYRKADSLKLAGKKSVGSPGKITDRSYESTEVNSTMSDCHDSADKGEGKLLEVGLLCDCTGSMAEWIERAKQTLNQIIENTIKSCDGKLRVRVCFVGYRDVEDTERFSIIGFDNKVDKVKKFISTVEADGGGDEAEDVLGGIQKML